MDIYVYLNENIKNKNRPAKNIVAYLSRPFATTMGQRLTAYSITY